MRSVALLRGVAGRAFATEAAAAGASNVPAALLKASAGPLLPSATLLACLALQPLAQPPVRLQQAARQQENL
jgi:hypothetical protein